MKPRILVLALAAALGSGCASTDKPRMALQIESVMSIRDGVPSAQSYYQLGRYYHGQKRLAQAEEAYLKAITVDERHIDTLNALGSLYAERGELKRSTQTFEKVTTLAPNAAYLYNNLGYAYYLQGRLDEAYAAVHKALSLDGTLERGWVNLEHIAAKSSSTTLVATVKTRRLEALPTEFAAKAIADEPASESTTQATQMASQETKPVETAGTTGAEQESAKIATAVVSSPPAQEAVSNAAHVKAAQAEAASSGDTGNHDMTVPAALIEVTNGNGVARFARDFSAQLREDNIPVARITNLTTFSVKKTVIEYQPGYEVAARVLMNRTRLQASLVPAARPRPRSDVRIVLGRDAVPYLASGPLNLAVESRTEHSSVPRPADKAIDG